MIHDCKVMYTIQDLDQYIAFDFFFACSKLFSFFCLVLFEVSSYDWKMNIPKLQGDTMHLYLFKNWEYYVVENYTSSSMFFGTL